MHVHPKSYSDDSATDILSTFANTPKVYLMQRRLLLKTYTLFSSSNATSERTRALGNSYTLLARLSSFHFGKYASHIGRPNFCAGNTIGCRSQFLFFQAADERPSRPQELNRGRPNCWVRNFPYFHGGLRPELPDILAD
jgi:hypothetical protein